MCVRTLRVFSSPIRFVISPYRVHISVSAINFELYNSSARAVFLVGISGKHFRTVQADTYSSRPPYTREGNPQELNCAVQSLRISSTRARVCPLSVFFPCRFVITKKNQKQFISFSRPLSLTCTPYSVIGQVKS